MTSLKLSNRRDTVMEEEILREQKKKTEKANSDKERSAVFANEKSLIDEKV